METCARGPYKSYDHRLRALIVQANNPTLFDEVNVSTGKSWIRRGYKAPQTLALLDANQGNLIIKLKELERDLEKASMKIELLETQVELFDWTADWQRMPDGDKKKCILDKIGDCSGILSISECLKTLKISASRYRDWRRREKNCSLDDKSSCPKSHPMALTHEERATMKEMVQSKDFVHFPVGSLAKFARRAKILYAAASTWGKEIRENNWLRPRKRRYPLPPKEGIRATSPNQIFHIDVTILKLVDGTKAYVHTVIDNFSRKILACTVASNISAINTEEILIQAIQTAVECGCAGIIDIFSDKGCENVNDLIKELFKSNDQIRHILAQIDVSFSNSMIERFFLSAKHNYLFLQDLSSIEVLRKHIEFYISEHNGRIPHSAFNGATPDEVYAETWGPKQVEELRQHHKEAVAARIATNKKLECAACPAAAFS